MNEGTDKYDDSAKGGYSYAEKLAAVADGLMAPEEIGMASAEEAQIKLLPDKLKKPVFGTTLMFRAGAIPLDLRAEWAAQDYRAERKIIAPGEDDFDREAWKEAHKNEFPIQGDLICGQAAAKFQRTFKDPILGLCQMLRVAADMLEAKYTAVDENETAKTADNQTEASNDQQS